MDNAENIATIESTNSQANLTALIDWLEFTVHDLAVDTIINLILKLDPKDFMEVKKGRFGYQKQKLWNAGTLFLLYNLESGNDKMGVHIILTGQACRQYEANKSIVNIISNSKKTMARHNFTRVDIAIDDKKDSVINFDKFLRYSEDGHVSSLWYKYSLIMERRISDTETLGRTLYYGSKKSKIFMRVYDKKLEQIKKAKANQQKKEELLKVQNEWTRMELVFREERAGMAADYILMSKEIGILIRGVLNQYIRFVEPNPNSTNQQKRRWDTAPWWQDIIEDVEKIKLSQKKADRRIEDMKDWVKKQISPTLATILEATEGDMSWLVNVIVGGSSRLKNKHKQAIHQYMTERKK
ncbi:replication initiation factor domain-containing protein (plasmid) [Psychrobacillus glaciei]|uniref:Replication initiation factor domain-containing protein n=1 Tax=Psychrobacillus glaciei TaxID=2283160 RepID=A0A5J6STE1_9BACI|nr:replication initiation factor domain-containing protein [Psychrobacillus glaciei]QFG01286.1 replication initiation factor domain-containing protein [Psychrobacillus glaciei]